MKMHLKFMTTLTIISVAFASSVAAAPPPTQPKLFVVISLDQFSAALFAEYRDRFTGGLKRMAREGVVFPSAYQSHAATETCPGHSTLLTGRHPSATGIVGNTWFDRATGKTLYCVFDPAGRVPQRDGQPRGPANLKVPTFGEWLKAANPASRNYAVSGKDRAAITMAGHDPDGVFWWDDENGFTTYVPKGMSDLDRLEPVAAFNAAYFASWKRGGAPGWGKADPRCTPEPQPSRFGGETIKHRIPPAGWTPPPSFRDLGDPDFTRRFRASPAIDRVTLALASQLLDRAKLGRGAAPDVLAVSLSAIDYVGHRYGTQGPEMCQQLMELDSALGSFIAKLDALKVPVVVALSADHGSVDAAERTAERGVPARRILPEVFGGEINRAVRAKLNLDFDPLSGGGDQIVILGEPAKRAAIEAATLAELRARPEVVAVFTKAELLASMPPRGKPADEMTLAERFALSADADRSGDIAVAFQPYTTFGNPQSEGDTVAGHGSVWNYDRRVPLLFWWPGATPFEQPLPVETTDIAPTLAALAHIKTPPVDGRCLDLDATAGDSCAR